MEVGFPFVFISRCWVIDMSGGFDFIALGLDAIIGGFSVVGISFFFTWLWQKMPHQPPFPN